MKTLLSCGFASTLLATVPMAQAQTTPDQLTGDWTVVTLVTDTADGRIEPFGPTPLGYVSFGPGGHFSAQFMRPDIPKVAANNRLKASTEENVAIAQGSISFFGRWTLVDAESGEVGLRVLGSSYPNWIGSDQKRFIKVAGDSMTLTNPTSPAAGKSMVTLKRVR